jgi:hypothetical protein
MEGSTNARGVFMKTKSYVKSNQNPEIPKFLLDEFLELKINLSKINNLKQIKSYYLWERSNVERYRINIWTESDKNRNGDIIKGNNISHSFFVHFDTEEMIIVDKTKP